MTTPTPPPIRAGILVRIHIPGHKWHELTGRVLFTSQHSTFVRVVSTDPSRHSGIIGPVHRDDLVPTS